MGLGPNTKVPLPANHKGGSRLQPPEMLQTATHVPGMEPESGGAAVDNDESFNYITGWRLQIITAAIFISIFLINFEITIVSTTVVPIANYLHDFAQSSWVITAYLCTYLAGLVLWAKLSDIFGRKKTLLLAMSIFTVFSGGCGAAQTMVQLIICRAFQGIGGGGIYSISLIMTYELVPEHKYPLYTGLATIAVALGLALGPLLGGLIANAADSSVWRWTFLVNCPAGVLAGIVLLVTVPHDFPYQGRERKPLPAALLAVDFTGALLMFVAIVLLLTGLEQASSTLDWTSATTLGPLCSSAVACIVFAFSQYCITKAGGPAQPVLPWRFLQDRKVSGIILNQFMTGAVSITSYYTLPLRWQVTAGMDPFQAGLRLIPLSGLAPVGIIMTAMASKSLKVSPLYAALLGAVLQVIGLAFLSQVPTDNPNSFDHAVYGIEAVVGLGLGAGIGLGSLLPPFLVERRDLGVVTGVVVQARFLGGAVLIAIVTAVGNIYARDRLLDQGILTLGQIEALFQSTQILSTFPPNTQSAIRRIFTEAFNLETKIILGFAVAAVFTTAMIWQRPQVRIT